ncbi:FERM and PDZ domain-containing protein 2 [Manis javanica]|nr:FERM and PDZ domain-containing protein 2 [Manis javanica]
MALGICAKPKKFTITSSTTGKKHAFVTESANTCEYLLRLCSAQHGFNAQVRSPRAVTGVGSQDGSQRDWDRRNLRQPLHWPEAAGEHLFDPEAGDV